MSQGTRSRQTDKQGTAAVVRDADREPGRRCKAKLLILPEGFR